MKTRLFRTSTAAAAVAAAFAAGSAHAYVIIGSGASSINQGLLTAIIEDDCTAGTISYYDNSTSAPTNAKLANGTVFTVSCTPLSSGRFTSTPLNVSFDSTGGSWKAFLATTPAFYATAQTSTDPLSQLKVVDPALTACSGAVNNYTSKLANGTLTTLTYNWGCSSVAVGTGGNTDTPDFGLTEGEPKLYVNATANQPLVSGTWNTGAQYLLSPFTLGSEYSGFGSGVTGGIQVFGVVSGIAVSGPLYGALQNDQLIAGILPSSCGTGTSGSTAIVSTSAACAPFLSKSQYASIMATTGGASLQSAGPLFQSPSNYADLSLEWARRDQGSGIQATSAAYFLSVGCSNSLTESPDAQNLPLSSVQQGGSLPIIITYNPSTNDVLGRLQGVATTANGVTNAYPTSGFVIGPLTGEKYASSTVAATGTWANSYNNYGGTGSGPASGGSSTPWGFLRLEGFLPTVANVNAGLYTYSVTDFLHCSPTASGDGAQLCLDLAGKTSGATSLQVFSATGPTGIYPISSANGGVYYTNGKTCSGLRHH